MPPGAAWLGHVPQGPPEQAWGHGTHLTTSRSGILPLPSVKRVAAISFSIRPLSPRGVRFMTPIILVPGLESTGAQPRTLILRPLLF